MTRRYFTPSEAAAMLPQVVALMERARALLTSYSGVIGEDHRAEVRGEVEGILDRFQELGVDLKGLDTGLVDFPALRKGREVCLCWQSGEGTLAWWHPIEGGFVGRKPLEGEDPADWEWCN